ncbi:MAG: hypothetical protein IJ193_02070, partial [Bacilli bacterium]|nr:hypothetical protein [Bacilli bacterium]
KSEVHTNKGIKVSYLSMDSVDDNFDYGDSTKYDVTFSITNTTGKDITYGKLDFKLYRDKDDYSTVSVYITNLKKDAKTEAKGTIILSNIDFYDYDFDVVISDDMGDMAK